MRGGKPARWHVLYAAMEKLEPHELLHYEQMGALLGLDFIERRGAIASAAARAATQLALEGRMVLRVVRGHGYERANPGQVLDMVAVHQERSRKEIDRAVTKVAAVPVQDMDGGMARIFEATRAGLSAQQQALASFDMRLERRAAVTAAATRHVAAMPSVMSAGMLRREGDRTGPALALQSDPSGV